MVLSIEKRRAMSLACLFVVPAAIAIGAQLGTQIAVYGLIAFTIAVLILAAVGKIASSEFPYYIYAITLGMMWQTTMCGAHVVGSDMHGEFYVSNTVMSEGWDYAKHYGTQSSTSIVVGLIAPLIGKVIGLVWAYKIVLPVLFSFVPVILYIAFKKQFGAQIAFYAALFFMIVPISSMEMAQIGKSMVAELFFALMILLMVVKIKNLYKAPLILISLIGMIFCHYTIALAGIMYLLGIIVCRVIASPIKWQLFAAKRVKIIVLITILLISTTTFVVYYRNADNGSIMGVVDKIIPGYTEVTVQAATNTMIDSSTGNPNESYTYIDMLSNQEILVKTALGLDFANASLQGKLFRILQYLTQLAIIIGGIMLLRRYKHYNMSAEFVAAIGASYILLAFCVFVPHFSLIINMTRFYQLSLFLLAPVFVIGIRELCRGHNINWQLPVAGLMIVYYIYTSGLVFEMIKSNSIDNLSTPYSAGLSAERTGVYSIYTADDVKVVEWLAANNDSKTRIVGDYNGRNLIASYIGFSPQVKVKSERFKPTFDTLPLEAYVFATSWNTRNGQYINNLKSAWGGAGLRQSFPMPEWDYPIVFRSGDAVVYGKWQ